MSSPESEKCIISSLNESSTNNDELKGDNETTEIGNSEDNLDDPNQYEDRFRVDRRKLEQMLHGDTNRPTSEAEDFFLEIMESTNTQITWPSKLKIGAKSKKDPHIKVCGEPENVKMAKEKIMAVLDTKSNRVTLKMDVSHTEHSHIIGKGGNNIKKVMEETGCHIHFPDSNRNNMADKSNQVSIAGQPYGVESARLKIRELLPVAFSFEVPITGILQMHLDPNSPVVSRIQQQYNVTITFKQRPRSFTWTVVVRGTVIHVKPLKEATVMLMEHLTGSVGTTLPVNVQLEVAAQHHLFMIGRGGSNLQQIMNTTGATISFPDLNPMTNQSKSTVYISGTVDSVLAARECLIGCLPLVLMFDMKEEIERDQGFVNALMEKLDVFISIKPKPKQPSKSVIVKSIEENSTNMYEARRQLLGLETEEMPRRISNHTTNTTISSLQGVLAHNLLNVTTAPSKPLFVINPQLSPLASPRQSTHISPPWFSATHGMLTPSLMMVPNTPVSNQALLGDRKLSSPVNGHLTIAKDYNENTSKTINANVSSKTLLMNGHESRAPFLKSASAPESPEYLSNQSSIPNYCVDDSTSNTDRSSPSNTSPALVNSTQSVAAAAAAAIVAAQRQQSQVNLDVLTKALKQDLNLSSSGRLMDSVGQKLKFSNSGSTASLRGLHQRAQLSGKSLNTQRSFSLSMSLNGSQSPPAVLPAPTADFTYDKKAPGIERLLNKERLMSKTSTDRLMLSAHDRLMSSHHDRLMASGNRNTLVKPPPGIDQVPTEAVHPANVSAALADYERKKVMASKAIEQEPAGETRNPTDVWSGLGFSRSMPDSVIRERLQQNNIRYDGSNMGITYEQQESEEDEDPWKDRLTLNGPPVSSNPPDHLYDKLKQYGLNTGSTTNNNQVETSSSPQSLWSTKVNNVNENCEMNELFHKIGLDKYIELFQQQEIDLATFTTLNDQDLKELGVNTFGARRKMLMAIADLQKSRQKYFSPTPGSNNPFRSTAATEGPFPRGIDVISHSGKW